MIAGDGAGLVNVPALKGIHYAMRSGMVAAESAFETLAPGRTAWEPGALESYDEGLKESYVWKDLERVRNMRPAFHHGFTRGAMLAGVALNTLGKLPPRDLKLERDAEVPVFVGDRLRSYPDPDGQITFDKLSSVYLSGLKTRDDAPSHLRVDRRVRREVAEAWVHMCPAQVYELGGAASPAGNVVDVEVTASNCVQCGAITAKGGRLTPPEGGDGPEYRLMCARSCERRSSGRRPWETRLAARPSSRPSSSRRRALSSRGGSWRSSPRSLPRRGRAA
jgi:electron-transferring-flavoprotein dehydrogenase